MVDAVVAVQWLEKLQNTLEPYPGAYLALMISALLVAAGLANWVTKRILLRGLRRLLNRLPLHWIQRISGGFFLLLALLAVLHLLGII